ncbi:NAD(P)-binding protein [Aspergillus minisclerotigenes]|uniref:NAD(P)-binding protein n=1 Tax=Aspergillus minisclerotigenes TaxID=656917 RepID=A0A5N6IVM3_9EURO|nr:NAD(P)-binding protein [Aspergillus minisclerotigenes]
MHANSDTLTDGMIRSEHAQLNGVPVLKRILVTGGAGFTGGWFVRHLLQTYGDRYAVTYFDNLDYCASVNNFKAVAQLSNFHFVRGNVCTPKDVENALRNYHIDSIVHFAARSHVDTSLNDPLSFTQTNVIGTQVPLEVARELGSIRRFINVSTDEVYGEYDAQNPTAFTEEQSLHPTNPYSASKAATEMIIQAYRKSFHIPLIIVRCNDVFGPRQYPEKKKNTDPWRWPHISGIFMGGDAAEALDVIFHKGTDGETYNISSNDHLQVRQVAEKTFRCFYPDETYESDNWIEFVADRPFNDGMYWTDDSKLRVLGWTQRTNFDEALRATVNWYCRDSEGFWPNMRAWVAPFLMVMLLLKTTIFKLCDLLYPPSLVSWR